MSLSVAKDMGMAGVYSAEVGIVWLECSICKTIFSSSMEGAWPFCSAGIPHEKIDSQEQQRRRSLLTNVPEKATGAFVNEIFKLYGPHQLKYSWKDSDLPSFPELETVTLTKEKMREFSDRYKIACEFIGSILGKSDFTFIDLISFSKLAWFRNEKKVT